MGVYKKALIKSRGYRVANSEQDWWQLSSVDANLFPVNSFYVQLCYKLQLDSIWPTTGLI